MKIEHRELDRLLCERAGIAGKVVHDYHDCDLETFDWGNPWRNRSPECTCSPSKEYPAVSTEGNAMLLLIDKLWELSFYTQVTRRDSGFVVTIGAGIRNGSVAHEVAMEQQKTAPRAVALAAARAWGIEVPAEEGE